MTKLDPRIRIHGKAVRDKAIDHIRREGLHPLWHYADTVEWRRAILAKLVEEAHEAAAYPEPALVYTVDRDHLTEKLGDLLEVAHTIAATFGIPWEYVEDTRDIKRMSRGGFDRRVILDEVTA